MSTRAPANAAHDVRQALDALEAEKTSVLRHEQQVGDERRLIGGRGQRQDVAAGRARIAPSGRIAATLNAIVALKAEAIRHAVEPDVGNLERELHELEARACELDDELRVCRRALDQVDADIRALYVERQPEWAALAEHHDAAGLDPVAAAVAALEHVGRHRRNLGQATSKAAAGISDADERARYIRRFRPWFGRVTEVEQGWRAVEQAQAFLNSLASAIERRST